MHLAIFAIPLKLAHRLDIPLVVWGENSAFEYGGDEEARRPSDLMPLAEAIRCYRWYDGAGLDLADLNEEELAPISGPRRRVGGEEILAVFMGLLF